MTRVYLKGKEHASPRVNAGCLCSSGSLALYRCSFTLRNGMEEVIGSIPIRSTNQPHMIREDVPAWPAGPLRSTDRTVRPSEAP